MRLPSFLLAAIADHAEVCRIKVAMFGGILVHAMLFHFIFDFFFGLVQVGRSHFAGHGHSVSIVRRKFERLAVELPGRTILGRQLVLVSALGFRQTARQRADFGALVLGVTNRRNHQQQTQKWSSSLAVLVFPDWGARRPPYAVLVPPLMKCKTRSTIPTTSRM